VCALCVCVYDLFFKILIWLYDNHVGLQTSPYKDTYVKGLLLQGMSDTSPIVQKKLYEFWDDKNRLSDDIIPRLVGCMRTLYHPQSESQWLHYCTYLLLQPTRQSADFERPISDVPLADCKFRSVSIDTSYQASNYPMVPLFSSQVMCVCVCMYVYVL